MRIILNILFAAGGGAVLAVFIVVLFALGGAQFAGGSAIFVETDALWPS